MTHEVWVDGSKVADGSKRDCENVAVFIRQRLRESNEKVAGRVGVHPVKEEDNG